MPVCPACHTEQKKRVDGACPGCGVPVDVYKGHWYRSNLGSPTVALVTHLEKRVGDHLSRNRDVRVPYTIPRKGLRYKRELAVAERLLEACDFDFDLAVDSLNILYDDSRFNWKLRDSLLWIEKDFNTSLALARASRMEQELRRKKEQQAVQAAMSREDIFS